MMVKLTGPGLGKKAGGSLAGQLTFSNWKGKAYLKKLTKAKQPQTPRQVAMRAVMSFLSAEWAGISDPRKATWDDLAANANISPFNAYQKENLKRARNMQAPSQVWPATETGTDAQWLSWPLLCHGRYLTERVLIGTLNDGWGVGFYSKLAWPYPTEWYQLIGMTKLVTGTYTKFDFHPKQSGDWYCAFRVFTYDGKPKPDVPKPSAFCTCTV